MSKTLYQIQIQPETRQGIEQILVGAILSEKFKPTKEPNVYAYGSGWLTAKRKIEYKLTDNTLSICIWKVVAPFLPMIEMGCDHANSAYGMALNGSMKAVCERILGKIGQSYPTRVLQHCQVVEDNYLLTVQW